MKIILKKKPADDVRSVLLEKRKKPKKEDLTKGPLLSTGSMLLNMAISDRPEGCLRPGHYFYIVGDSASGKTAFSMTCFAEALASKEFQHYRIILNNVEDGMLFDVVNLFGARVAKRIEYKQSETIEEFYYDIDDELAKGEPMIYVLDSMDGLTSEAEDDKFEQQKKAHKAGKEVAGSYGDGKAKQNSQNIRRLLKHLKRTGSILIIISQTRDNVGGGMWAPKKTRSGGRALRFYATWEVWTSVVGKITKTVRGRIRNIGSTIKLQVVKNRLTGKLNEVEVPIYPSYGIDDIGSCIDWLVDEKWWTRSKHQSKIIARGLTSATDIPMRREDLVKVCETSPHLLRKALRACWDAIQRESILERTPRYS